jgi:hypothetical protein
MAWRIGALFMWLYRLRKLNGPNFTWPLMMFAGVAPETILQRMGKIYVGNPLVTRNRRDLIGSLRPNYLQHLRADNGDVPERWKSSTNRPAAPTPIPVTSGAHSLRILP